VEATMALSDILQLTPVIVGSLLIAALGVGFFVKGATWEWLAALFLGAALCGSSVFASLSWDKTSGKIETIAGATKASADVAKQNSDDIATLKDSIKAINTRIDALASLAQASRPDAGPALGKWQSTLDELQKSGAAADQGIGNLEKSQQLKQPLLNTLQIQLDKIK
jgi:hypothetical protein